MAEQVNSLANVNKQLGDTLDKIKEINRNPIKPGQTKVGANLEEELKRRKLTTNDPT